MQLYFQFVELTNLPQLPTSKAYELNVLSDNDHNVIFEVPSINFDTRFNLSMGWQIIMVSFGAYAILMYLIKTGTASKTSSLFFLVPPVTAIMAWLVLGEKLSIIDIIGLLICAFGVYIATRK